MALNRFALLLVGMAALPATAAERLFKGLDVEEAKGLVLESLVGPSDKTKCLITGETLSTLNASCQGSFLSGLAIGVPNNMFSGFEGTEARFEHQFVFIQNERGTRLLMQTFSRNMYKTHGAITHARLSTDKGDQQFLDGLQEQAPGFLKMIAKLDKLQQEKKLAFEDLWEALPLGEKGEDRSEDVDKWASRMKQPSTVAIAVGASGQMAIGTALGQADQDVADASALEKCNAAAKAEGLGRPCGVVFRSRKVDVEAFRQQVEVARTADYPEWLRNIEASLLKWDDDQFE